MTFTIQYHVKSKIYSAFYQVKSNRIRVCENGRDANILFQAIKDTIQAVGPNKKHSVIWRRLEK